MSRTNPTWRVPKELPDLRRVDLIGFDIETNDEGLRADRGSAWPWRGGHITGVSVAWREGGDIRAIYAPLRHPDTANFDPARTTAGWRICSRPVCASSRKTAAMITAGYDPRPAS